MNNFPKKKFTGTQHVSVPLPRASLTVPLKVGNPNPYGHKYNPFQNLQRSYSSQHTNKNK
ncbi:hypothetical protein QJS04_geneDACA014383 [Acorus gramineus]|uniref:Uncharacterized protein n=1 Tax=Acorus gramineus TaxID=55184 RepID=A0AAV8ZYN0_ACOGR|nr:hypothetical protein QJS04_geneDACA014383 [Acorus gramineus]